MDEFAVFWLPQQRHYKLCALRPLFGAPRYQPTVCKAKRPKSGWPCTDSVASCASLRWKACPDCLRLRPDLFAELRLQYSGVPHG